MDEERERRLLESAHERVKRMAEEGDFAIPDQVIIHDIGVMTEDGVTKHNLVFFVCDVNDQPEEAVIIGVGLQFGFINEHIKEEP